MVVNLHGRFYALGKIEYMSRSRPSSAVKCSLSDLSQQVAEPGAGRCCWGVRPCAELDEAIGGRLQLP
jgi:hypothetical protein